MGVKGGGSERDGEYENKETEVITVLDNCHAGLFRNFLGISLFPSLTHTHIYKITNFKKVSAKI